MGQRLADLTMTPLEGELALQWLGDSMAGAVLRARLSGAPLRLKASQSLPFCLPFWWPGASAETLTTAYLTAAQVPQGSRSVSRMASIISGALPLQTQERGANGKIRWARRGTVAVRRAQGSAGYSCMRRTALFKSLLNVAQMSPFLRPPLWFSA